MTLIKVLVMGTLLQTGAIWATTLKVKTAKALVYQEPRREGDVLETLVKGNIVKSIGRKGMFWKVSLPDGRQGFVSVMKMKRQSTRDSGLKGVLRDAAKKSRADGNNLSLRVVSSLISERSSKWRTGSFPIRGMATKSVFF